MLYSTIVRKEGLSYVHKKVIALTGYNKRVLDIGCSSGYMAQILKESYGCQVVGIEGDSTAAVAARAFCEQVIVGDIEDAKVLAAATGKYDVIIMADILEHLKDPKQVLAKAREFLSPEGYILVSGPNIACWEIRKSLLLGRFRYEESGILDRTHLRFFTYDTWRELIVGSGYIIEDFWAPYFYYPGKKLIDMLLKRIPKVRRLTGWLDARLLKISPNLCAVCLVFKAHADQR